ncbi:hypothetical protein ACFSEO_17115 [Agromyces cerinus subsp. nitratus]|uniref:hypothetical protein n=1 Tax=Agromyces cerinus TaxID=33878 RepID=UPI003640B2EF
MRRPHVHAGDRPFGDPCSGDGCLGEAAPATAPRHRASQSCGASRCRVSSHLIDQ